MTSKRVLDVTAAALLAALTLPVLAVLAIVLAVHLRAWPFFTHERIGRGGAPIRVTKLRTLSPCTRPYALKTEVELATSRLCQVLRRLHLDELPQLWLVVTGAMSLVGPRPKMPDEHEPVDPLYGLERVTVPQGITGLWQVSDATDVLPSEAAEFDLFYVRNRTFLMDLWILWRTVGVVLGLGSGVRLADVPSWALPLAARPVRRVVVSTEVAPITMLGRRALDAAHEARAAGHDVVLRAPVPRTEDGSFRRGYGRFTRRDLVDGFVVRRSSMAVTPGDGVAALLGRMAFVLVTLLALAPERLLGRTEVVLITPPGVIANPLLRMVATGCRAITVPADVTPAPVFVGRRSQAPRQLQPAQH